MGFSKLCTITDQHELCEGSMLCIPGSPIAMNDVPAIDKALLCILPSFRGMATRLSIITRLEPQHDIKLTSQ
jgi:hypothetical protein